MTTQTEFTSDSTFIPARLNTQAEIHELLANRRSPRAFSDRTIEPDTITKLFEAARWSPSSANEQPWYFIVAAKEDSIAYSALHDSLAEGNQRWAAKAPLLVLALARTTYSRNGQAYQHSWYDLGQSIASLSVQATAIGLAVHQMGGFDPVKVIQQYPIPEGFVPVVIFAVGYPDQADGLPEDLQKRERAPRSRKPLEEFVFTDQWGKLSRHIQSRSVSHTQSSAN
ncbi:MAG: nitroreductase family protein [Ignavibacteriales bacterium]|nr:nitroreductase family protein [Ignavibacteriales bacterium]